MEFFNGLLADRLTVGLFTPREAAELCAQIADALHHAHESGVIHRDLKPSNIMLDGEGAPHLMDFGLAKREAGEITMTVEGKLLGTPAYMSPEQARGEGHHVDRRTDVYSLGVILFELLTGKRPFQGNLRMLLHQVINDEPPRPRSIDRRVPRDLETVCMKCMEKNVNRRYATANDVANELHCYLEGKPITGKRITSIERLWRRAKRFPVTTALGLALSLAVICAIGSATALIAARSNSDVSPSRNSQKLEELLDVASLVELEITRHYEILHRSKSYEEVVDEIKRENLTPLDQLMTRLDSDVSSEDSKKYQFGSLSATQSDVIAHFGATRRDTLRTHVLLLMARHCVGRFDQRDWRSIASHLERIDLLESQNGDVTHGTPQQPLEKGLLVWHISPLDRGLLRNYLMVVYVAAASTSNDWSAGRPADDSVRSAVTLTRIGGLSLLEILASWELEVLDRSNEQLLQIPRYH